MTIIPVFPGDAVFIFFSCSAVHFFFRSADIYFSCVCVCVLRPSLYVSVLLYRIAPTTATRAAAASTKTGARVTAADETDAFSPVPVTVPE